MPDIKTALQQALAKTATDWAADDEAHQKIEPVTTPKEITMPAPETHSVSRATFEFVRDNPGVTIDEAVATLEKRGFKPNSVSSLIYQMKKVPLVVADANGKLTAVVKQYVPIQTNLIRKRRAKAKEQAKPAPAPVVEAPIQRKYVALVNPITGAVLNPRKEEWTVESVIGGLNVRQAMAVYDELRKIFGA